ncbi:tRNA lysidine(34) synthetase TilS [Baekduia sp. Peel2402]|uniref:tRNA lysidine(34) synthetase TilS n=1 Tax=Baekduia sp. Peel2402 TaxID=3458296 RepID=UPI00403EC8FD
MDVVPRVRATGLVVEGEPLVVMLSGGRDSVCLLHVAVELGAVVTALHVDYGLRGSESDGDRERCVELCASLGVPLEIRRVARADDAVGNLHAWARDVRYAAAAELGDRVAVAHTLTDQVETILYRLASSPGRRALAGMEAVRGPIVRPLLAAGIRREETASYCMARSLVWREDTSNTDRAYARARVREDLLPALRAVDPRAEANVLRTAEILREEALVLDEVVAEVIAGRAELPRAELAALPPALGRLVLRRLAEDAIAAPCARAAGRLGEVLALGDEGALDLGDGARAIVRAGVLSVGRTPARPSRR